jgi:hypothetical protein
LPYRGCEYDSHESALTKKYTFNTYYSYFVIIPVIDAELRAMIINSSNILNCSGKKYALKSYIGLIPTIFIIRKGGRD